VTRVLVIDDEPSILRALRINLTARNYEVSTASDGASGLAAVSRQRPDVLILDLGLPDMDGTEVILGVRGWTSTPIIVLSVWGQEHQKVAALDAGADDYVTKPFGMDELLARLRAAVRRAAPAPDEPVVTTPDFTVDLAAKRVTRDGSGDVRLTPTEWQLLEILVRNRGRLVTQRQLLQEVWGPAYGSESNYLRVYVAQLRRKLEPEPSRPRYLLTDPGMGYRFQVLPPGTPLTSPRRRVGLGRRHRPFGRKKRARIPWSALPFLPWEEQFVSGIDHHRLAVPDPRRAVEPDAGAADQARDV
jgi:two-component system KDP operon response regulator KdpE